MDWQIELGKFFNIFIYLPKEREEGINGVGGDIYGVRENRLIP